MSDLPSDEPPGVWFEELPEGGAVLEPVGAPVTGEPPGRDEEEPPGPPEGLVGDPVPEVPVLGTEVPPAW